MRPEILFPLFRETRVLPGIGPRIAVLVEKLAGPHVKDLLFLKPTGLVDRSRTSPIASAPTGEIVTIEAQVETHIAPPRGSFKPYKVRLSDETGFLHLVFFHPRADYLRRTLPEGETRVVSGKLERFGSEIQIAHPDLIMTVEEAATAPALEPVYPLTAGLSPKTLRKAIAGALKDLPALPEWIPSTVSHDRGWPDWRIAIETLHTPLTVADVDPASAARQRLAFDELFARQMTLQITRAHRRSQTGRALEGDGKLVERVLVSAPFNPTGAQTRAFEDIAADMARPQRMTRLLHGDVGAGKTFVAALAAARAAEAAAQTAVMAPTEILARQHAKTLEPLLGAAGIKVAALTGRDKGNARAGILAGLASGEVQVICGTHALFQEGVEFHDLGLVVIDEQHRFGVSDRMKLSAKGARPDSLVMTATPIPRTLTMTVYGDLDVSRLDEKPAGRKPPDTRLVSMDRLGDVVAGIERAVKRGERAYWVCPLVEESDLSDLSAAQDRHHHLSMIFGADRVGLVHGRMKAAEKEAVSDAFRRGELDILVATTVIEVGVDAPDATIMIIEHAERFGLAQLHQLRGRVGRSDKASTCLLLYQGPLGETARSRLEIMRETNDGFRIAEEDWRLRGSGDPLGLKQSGLPAYKLVDVEAHADLIALANDAAKLAVGQNPDFTGESGEALRVLLYLFEQDQGIRLMRSG
ncbi:ATP-dependent DNA helicase RecG [Hyphobacterium marinum]|uniref:Probable DNA 3'-5' helicase RecG n=1 Tax=Hyphobacterium marinum TaxID=3116574 RepID=A0ABU7LYM6_9PROT|nr:ATP-dependent DNA helicase RecG [Hyphobacterium sp. Y6023]MEE2566630.1 ATP-dependent DNA helicase RecG [Hyphobacterium sp. Y6023]